MAKKIYAIKKGHKTGLFYNWDSCKKNIIGYSGAIYKGFDNEKDALEYLR